MDLSRHIIIKGQINLFKRVIIILQLGDLSLALICIKQFSPQTTVTLTESQHCTKCC